MANIFNFPSKKKKASEKDFLQTSSELVQFDAAGCEVDLPEQKPAPTPPAALNDWSNQELASIYRVKRLLDAAGVACHLERSLSDEGDPWCIFCTPMGEVFIHLTRIDGLYVLDSPNLVQPIFGRDFNELIEQFSSGALKGTEKAAQARRRLIRLERNGKVFLHPATLLAALIWSIYLNSEDLVFFVPEEEDATDSDAAIAHVVSAAEAQNAEDAEMEAVFVNAVAHPDVVISAHLPETADIAAKTGGPFFKEIIAKSGLVMAPSAMALGLSSIAIAYGFMSEGYFEEDSAVQADLVSKDSTELDTELAEVELEDQTPLAPPSFDLTAVLGTVLAEIALPTQDEMPVVDENAATVDIAQLLNVDVALPEGVTAPAVQGTGEQRTLAAFSPEADVEVAQVETASLEEPETEKEPAVVTAEAPLPVSQLSDDADVLDVASVSTALFSLADLKDSFAEQLTAFSFGDTLVEASFDIASLTFGESQILDATVSFDMPVIAPAATDQPAATVGMIDPALSEATDVLAEFFQRPIGGMLIDENAISFVAFLMQKDTDLQIISHEDEIVLIDFQAFTQPGGDVLAMSWELEHGGTVQTIGLRSDFAEFDLIA